MDSQALVWPPQLGPVDSDHLVWPIELASQVQGQLWDPAVLEHWAAAFAIPSLQTAHPRLAGPHDIGTQFIRQSVMESQTVWPSHAKAREGLVRARAGTGGTMVRALRKLQLHQQTKLRGVPKAALN